MKAKVIETGEIVNVTPNPTWYKEDGHGPDRREWDEDELEFIKTSMTTSELLITLPSHIGRNPMYDQVGNIIGYTTDNKDGGDIGWLYLHNDGRDWRASYGEPGKYVCMNPDDEDPPYNNAVVYGSTPHEALQKLYDWCVENGFIKNNE